MYENKGIKILGTGSYIPPLAVKNDDFKSYIETDDEWITTRTGIKQRHFLLGKPNHYMAVRACAEALENAGTEAEEIDLILSTSCSPDFSYPSLACIVQHETGARNAACIDVNSACAGFITVMDIARSFLISGQYKKILIIASEKISSHLDFTDRATCVLFGDGAGAVVVEAAENEYFSFLGATGDDVSNLSVYYKYQYNVNIPFKDENAYEADETGIVQNEPLYKNGVQMDGKAVYKFAVEAMPKAVNAVLAQAGLTVDDIDLLIPHQANIRIIQTAAKTLKISMDKVYTNIETNGNTSSACIPTCLDELNKAGRLKKGMRFCMVGFGGGLNYGAVLMKM